MQHGPRFLNYTTDRVRGHQRLNGALYLDLPRTTAHLSWNKDAPVSLTVSAADATGLSSVVRAKTPMQCVGR
jgi:hypothetical protein